MTKSDSGHRDAGPAGPRLARWLAGLRVPPEEREFAIGDLEEEFEVVQLALGVVPARRWYWRQAFQALRRSGPHGHGSPSPPFQPGEQMKGLLRDAKLAARRMWIHPIVSFAAVLTFALGIGANVAMFSVAWPVLFAPLPFADEANLSLVSLTYPRNGATARNSVSRGDFVDLRTASSLDMAAYYKRTTQVNLTGLGPVQPLTLGTVTPEFFPLLGIRPIAGSLHSPSGSGGPNLIVLSEQAWRSRFGGERNVVGKTLRLDGTPYEVLGVAPAASGLGTVEADGWQIASIDGSDRRRGAYFLGVVARVKPGVTLEAANAELAAIMARAAIEFPQFNRNISALAEPLREQVTGPIRPTLTLLLVSASMVLLIATINLTGLQRARDLERDRERLIRRALGASSWQLARQAIAEALALAAIGGSVGVLVALGIVSALMAVAPSFGWHQQLPTSRALVALYTIILTSLSGAAIALWPAWKTSRQPAAVSIQGRSITAGRAQMRMRAGVVATQVAMTAVLLVVAVLVAASQRNVLALETGFDPAGIRVANLNLPAGSYNSTVAAAKFYDTLAARLKVLPGVEESCVANAVPLDRPAGWMTYVPEGGQQLVRALPNSIMPACLDVLHVKVLAGRRVTNNEVVPSVMVSASMAKALFPDGRNPIGQRVHFGLPTGDLLTIVGVLDDIRDGSLETSDGKHVWAPQSLGHFPMARLLVRYGDDAVFDDGVLRAAVNELAPNVALDRPRALSDVVLRATSSRRFVLFLLSGFAVVAVLLCGIGLYGLLAHAVGQRTREIGIRMALGAGSGQLLRLMLWQITLAVGLGIGAGLLGARALTRFVRTLLYGITETDAATYVVVAAAVLMMTAVSVWAPTRRALRIDPRSAMSTD